MAKRKLLKDSLIIAGLTLSLFVAVEVALRLIFPEKITPPKGEKAYTFNKDYLISLKPNISKTFVRTEENGGDVIEWKTNRNGFRGKELREDAEARIIVYGDSNIQARFSKLEDTFAFRLEALLSETEGRRVEVVNGGVVGFGPDQSLLKFEHDAPIYHPDVVILHVFADNDFGDIVRNRLLELDQHGELVAVKHDAQTDEQLDDRFNASDFASSLLTVRAARRCIRQMSPSPDPHEAMENMLEHYRTSCEHEFRAYESSSPRRASHFLDHYDFDIATAPDLESSKVKVRLMEAVLRRAKSFAEANRIELVVLIQPSAVDLTRNFVVKSAPINYKTLSRFERYRKETLSDKVQRICSTNAIQSINLYDTFARNDPETLFFRGWDNHWNDQGQDLAAQVAAPILRDVLSKLPFVGRPIDENSAK